MTTQTMTAAEARRLADELTAAEKDLTARKREASKAAEAAACRAEFARADRDLIPAASAARARWQELAERDDVSIGDLFDAWTALRVATAERAAVIAASNTMLTTLEPRRHETSGQPIGHRIDVHDEMDGLSFVQALDGISRSRADRARNRALRATQEAVLAAGEAAAAEVK